MLVRGGRVIDPAQQLDRRLDVRVRGDVIAELGEHLEPERGEDTIDASEAYVAPGFIDMHVHLREPGHSQKETIASGTAAAAAGGFTAVACMPNTEPPLDDAERIAWVRMRASGASARVYPVAAITRGCSGEEAVDFESLQGAGAVAFSDDGSTVMNEALLQSAAEHARTVPGCFISHCEDEELKGDGVMHLGEVSLSLGLPGSPEAAEATIVERDLRIAERTRKSWHIAHLSTIGGLKALRAARRRGIEPTCEVTPHHLVFTDETVRERGGAAKVNPPLRPPEHVRALRDAVRDGTIDAFASDHAPHTDEEKNAGMHASCVGFSGLEIAVGAYAYALPDLPLMRYVALLSTNPARILNVPGGSLRPGAPADLTIFADRQWIVKAKDFASKGRSTPFEGMKLPRRAIATIVGGRRIA